MFSAQFTCARVVDITRARRLTEHVCADTSRFLCRLIVDKIDKLLVK